MHIYTYSYIPADRFGSLVCLIRAYAGHVLCGGNDNAHALAACTERQRRCFGVKGTLQLLSKRHKSNRFAQVPERISVSSSDGDHQRFILDLPMNSGTTRNK